MAKRISDESVKKATGKTWSEWFSIMNKAGAKKMEHKTVAELLYKRYGLSLWWSQMVTVQFEQEIKGRKKHETATGYQISKSITLDASIAKIFHSINSPIKTYNQYLSIAAMVLLPLVSLRFNGTLLHSRSNEIENKVYLTAFSLADDLIEEIKQKAFDEQTVEWRAIPADQLTPYNLFGQVDPGEFSVMDYDDIDDYNGYSKRVSLPHAGNYTVSSTVHYVLESDQNSVSLSQTYYKRVTVNVTSPYLSHALNLQFVFTLHSK